MYRLLLISLVFNLTISLSQENDGTSVDPKIAAVELKIQEALKKEDYRLAAKLKKEKEIRVQIQKALKNEDYKKAADLKEQLKTLQETGSLPVKKEEDNVSKVRADIVGYAQKKNRPTYGFNETQVKTFRGNSKKELNNLYKYLTDDEHAFISDTLLSLYKDDRWAGFSDFSVTKYIGRDPNQPISKSISGFNNNTASKSTVRPDLIGYSKRREKNEMADLLIIEFEKEIRQKYTFITTDEIAFIADTLFIIVSKDPDNSELFDIVPVLGRDPETQDSLIDGSTSTKTNNTTSNNIVKNSTQITGDLFENLKYNFSQITLFDYSYYGKLSFTFWAGDEITFRWDGDENKGFKLNEMKEKQSLTEYKFKVQRSGDYIFEMRNTFVVPKGRLTIIRSNNDPNILKKHNHIFPGFDYSCEGDIITRKSKGNMGIKFLSKEEIKILPIDNKVLVSKGRMPTGAIFNDGVGNNPPTIRRFYNNEIVIIEVEHSENTKWYDFNIKQDNGEVLKDQYKEVYRVNYKAKNGDPSKQIIAYVCKNKSKGYSDLFFTAGGNDNGIVYFKCYVLNPAKDKTKREIPAKVMQMKVRGPYNDSKHSYDYVYKNFYFRDCN